MAAWRGALMSIPAVKAVEIGMGFEAARRPGSEVHDPIDADAVPGTNAPDPALRGGYRRRSNNAGGLEGGVTTGEPLVIRVGMKPISTLMSPLPTVDLTTGKAANAQSERSDVTAVPAMGVIAEATDGAGRWRMRCWRSSAAILWQRCGAISPVPILQSPGPHDREHCRA